MSHPRFEDYRFEIRPLAAEEGGGYLVSFPDLPGCMSDGETYEEAIANARDAFGSWVAACQEEHREVPVPNAEGKPAKFVLRVPRHLHERVTHAAAADGVSVNTTVLVFIAEGLARREGKAPHSQRAATSMHAPATYIARGYAYGSAPMPVLQSDLDRASGVFNHGIDLLAAPTRSPQWTASDVKYLKYLVTAHYGNVTSATGVVPSPPPKRVRYA